MIQDWKARVFQVKGKSRSSWFDRKCTKTFYTSVVLGYRLRLLVRVFLLLNRVRAKTKIHLKIMQHYIYSRI